MWNVVLAMPLEEKYTKQQHILTPYFMKFYHIEAKTR